MPNQDSDNTPIDDDLSHTTPAILTTAPQDDESLGIDPVSDEDQAVPDSVKSIRLIRQPIIHLVQPEKKSRMLILTVLPKTKMT